jgi:hypothetical protein
MFVGRIVDDDDDILGSVCYRAHADEELRAEDQKNFGYREELAERDLASFEYHLKEERTQRIKEEDQRLERQQVEAELAQTDVEDYFRDYKDRHRLSLRAKEKSRHAQWKNKMQSKIAKKVAAT